MIYEPFPFKHCSTCKQWLPFIAFGKKSNAKDGLRNCCKTCHRANTHSDPVRRKQYLKQYRADNRERRNEYNRKYWHAHKHTLHAIVNREKKREYDKQYHVRHRTRKIAVAKQWATDNPEQALQKGRDYRARHRYDANYRRMKRATWHRYKTRKLNKPIDFTSDHWLVCLDYWHGCCAYCDNPPGLFPGMELTADHFIPITDPQCPGTILANIVPACKSCNSSKHNKNPHEWVQKFGKREAQTILKRIAAYFEWVQEQPH